MKSFFTSILFTIIIVSDSQGQLKIGVTKGQAFAVETTTSFAATAEVMGQTMETLVDSKSTTRYEIKNITPDALELTTTLTGLKMTNNSMGQTMSYDSEKKDNDATIASMLDTLINRPAMITLNNSGEITAKEAVSENAQSLIRPGNNAPSKNIELFLPALMGRKLKAVDSFPYTDSVKTEKSSSFSTGTFTITVLDDGFAKIIYTGSQRVIATMEQMGLEMDISSTNTINSSYEVQMKTGLVMSYVSNVDSNISIEASGITIPSSGKIKIESKIKPL